MLPAICCPVSSTLLQRVVCSLALVRFHQECQPRSRSAGRKSHQGDVRDLAFRLEKRLDTSEATGLAFARPVVNGKSVRSGTFGFRLSLPPDAAVVDLRIT